MAQSGISVHDADVSSHLHTNHGVTSKQKTLAVVHEPVKNHCAEFFQTLVEGGLTYQLLKSQLCL